MQNPEKDNELKDIRIGFLFVSSLIQFSLSNLKVSSKKVSDISCRNLLNNANRSRKPNFRTSSVRKLFADRVIK